ncbi:unnamed protein product [Cercospora beticola]|nr:unnamed protein product [Cercospora beticola]
MGPAQDHMASSFTARRPNASHLPAFELPPPPLTQKYHSGYSHVNHSQHSPATTLTSVGNLLTPPSNGSVDGISPATSVPQSNGAVQSYTPSNGSGMWPPPASNAPYGFQPSQPHHSSYQGTRSLFSPSLNSIIRGSNSPTASEALPPPPYSDMHHYPSSSIGMSQSTVPAPQQYSSMPVPAPVTQASPVHNQEAFARPPPTPTTSYYSQQSYSTGPSPVAQSPMSGGGLGKMSPVNQSGPVPPLHQSQSQYAQQYRPHSYSGMGGAAVLSGHSMGGVPGGMIPHFNSGHAAQMHHMYGHPQPNPQNDRPFRCDQCPQSFNRNHDLKRHKRIYLAVKPFPCGHCDKSFSRKDALKRHVLVKGCGKAGATSEVKELDGSISPKSESLENSPVVSATA